VTAAFLHGTNLEPPELSGTCGRLARSTCHSAADRYPDPEVRDGLNADHQLLSTGRRKPEMDDFIKLLKFIGTLCAAYHSVKAAWQLGAELLS
jgi:hypothetical protein